MEAEVVVESEAVSEVESEVVAEALAAHKTS